MTSPRCITTLNKWFGYYVWEKLLGIGRKGAATVIMKYVNDALGGVWMEIALGETGSLVVQNILDDYKASPPLLPPARTVINGLASLY